ncbi:MAG: hypothetical protein GEV08_02340 [Acidimicrobiia bacterium]|nr:hypothetical protein [Acidimicrobiia bacterium]
MLFKAQFWPGLADGSVTLTFRRWSRPQAKVGNRYRTPAGMLLVEAVDVVSADSVSDEEARRAGYADRAALLADLRGDKPLHRVRFRFDGADPRDELREAVPEGEELAALAGRLARLDRGGAWTTDVLGLIEANPGRRAGDLADLRGEERLAFKANVRKLKALGLTESLVVGYRLSPRGQAVLSWLVAPS